MESGEGAGRFQIPDSAGVDASIMTRSMIDHRYPVTFPLRYCDSLLNRLRARYMYPVCTFQPGPRLPAPSSPPHSHLLACSRPFPATLAPRQLQQRSYPSALGYSTAPAAEALRVPCWVGGVGLTADKSGGGGRVGIRRCRWWVSTWRGGGG